MDAGAARSGERGRKGTLTCGPALVSGGRVRRGLGERAWDAGGCGTGRRSHGDGPEERGSRPRRRKRKRAVRGELPGPRKGERGSWPSAGWAARWERGRRTGLMGFLGRVSVGLGFYFLVFFLLFLFYFYFLFFCKLTQTSLNSNKFEFKLPSTQPK